jgi:dTDP-4-dehydrorhamnose 3,5-epimerase
MHVEETGLCEAERHLNILRTEINDMCIIEPKVFGDARGFFFESYNERDFESALGLQLRFVQDNHSRSSHGVLRGLHYQLPPHAQGKLVRVAQGTVFHVVVDLRRRSPSFARWFGMTLTAESHRMVWVPAGLAHGFLVTSGSADFLYKTTDYYAPESERCLRWDDPTIGIAWPTLDRPPVLTDRDASAPPVQQIALFE